MEHASLFRCSPPCAASQENARKLIKVQEDETRLEEPDDLIVAEDVYQKKYGDYRTNNLGHRWVDWGDCKGVLVLFGFDFG